MGREKIIVMHCGKLHEDFFDLMIPELILQNELKGDASTGYWGSLLSGMIIEKKGQKTIECQVSWRKWRPFVAVAGKTQRRVTKKTAVKKMFFMV